jgi:prepilin-type N-terminal cleavage/methylation domain-containing protein
MHILKRASARRQKGDTLVEVLIAIAVVSMILGGAYVTTNRSLTATRAAQERSIALKLAESQIERLKGIVATNSIAVFGAAAPDPFCIDSTGAVTRATDPPCQMDTKGDQASGEPIFHMSIDRVGSQFTLTETWTNPGGKATDRLQLIYRVYP